VNDAFLGTTSGVLRLRNGALEFLGLDGYAVTALHASDDALLAGTYGDGLFRSIDGGRVWERIETGLTASTFRFVTAELAGSEPARVYRSSDGGQSWEELGGITRIAGHEQWFLPYSPRAAPRATRTSGATGCLWRSKSPGCCAATTAAAAGYASRSRVTRTCTM
jgi:hypothetical protein